MVGTTFDHLVVVGGMPGVGKTWLSERLSRALGYSLWSRDAVKESLFDALPPDPDRDAMAWSRHVGELAFKVFLDLAPKLGSSVVLDAHFQARFGGDADVRALDPTPTQIFVEAPLEVVLERHHTRRDSRHACHQPYPLPTLSDLEAAASFFGPLDLGGPTLVVDSAEPVDVLHIAEWVRQQRPNRRNAES